MPPVPPVQIVAVGVAVQVAMRAVHSVVGVVMALHWARVGGVAVPVPVLPIQIASVGLVGQVAMIWAHSGMVGVVWQTA